VLSGAEEVVSPLRWKVWQEELKEHPDTELVEFVVRGIRDGFRLGHDQSKVVLEQRGGTMYEATQHSEIIGDYLAKEVSAKRVWRLEETPQVTGVQFVSIWGDCQESKTREVEVDCSTCRPWKVVV